MEAQSFVVRWRPSGGRGEFEAVGANAYLGSDIHVRLTALGVTTPAELAVTESQGKPRLRKHDRNNRKKLHLVNLVMAMARLPDPAREDKDGQVNWPLEHKGFLVSQMDFAVVDHENAKLTIAPIRAHILHSDKVIDLAGRFAHLAEDEKNLPAMEKEHPALAAAINAHLALVREQVNDAGIREKASEVVDLQADTFGATNLAPPSLIAKLPPAPFEDEVYAGKEGRILTRLHSYKERDRTLASKAKELFKQEHGRLFCECCGYEPEETYGMRGVDRIDAHHKVPVEELMEDSTTTTGDLAMVCPNCHDVIHAKRPWISVEKLREELIARGKYMGSVKP